MNVVCVALIGKKNNPLYIRSTTEDPDDLTYTYMVHRYVTLVNTRIVVHVFYFTSPFLFSIFVVLN